VATEMPATQAKRILVVEDELMIRMLLENMLEELGYTVAAETARIEEALEATKNADFDLAILDANLNGQPVSTVADALVARGTPFVFATGYGELPEPYRDWPTLKKPFQMDGLKQMLQSALDSGISNSFRAGGHLGRGRGATQRAVPKGLMCYACQPKGHSGA
jgi:CheY-like chemotaxis protein